MVEASAPNVADKTNQAYGLGYMPFLDGLRGIAIILVLWYHAGGLFRGGFLGVDIFFVLSGFLITSLLIKEYLENKRLFLGRFFMRRALRLIPPLVVLLAVWGTVSILTGDDPQRTMRDIAIVFFYGGNWARAWDLGLAHSLGHTWSLSIEEQFYILWPVLFILLMRLGCSLRMLLALTMAAALATTALGAWWYHQAIALVEQAQLHPKARELVLGRVTMRLYNGLDTHSSGLLIGCALACFMSHWRAWMQRHAKPLTTASLIAAGVVVIAAFSVKWSEFYMFAGGFLLFALATATVMLGVCATETNPIRKVLQFSWLVKLGRLSYALYLWHYPVYHVIDIFLDATQSPVRWPVKLIVGGSISLLITIISYRYIEMPILTLKTQFQAPKLLSMPNPLPLPLPTVLDLTTPILPASTQMATVRRR
jgi:peptidoglycan/LPS O-acetylase OafA/YrhL